MTNPMTAQELDALVERLRLAAKQDDEAWARERWAKCATAITALRGEVDTLRTERDGLLAALRFIKKEAQKNKPNPDLIYEKASAAILAAEGATERAKEEPKP